MPEQSNKPQWNTLCILSLYSLAQLLGGIQLCLRCHHHFRSAFWQILGQTWFPAFISMRDFDNRNHHNYFWTSPMGGGWNTLLLAQPHYSDFERHRGVSLLQCPLPTCGPRRTHWTQVLCFVHYGNRLWSWPNVRPCFRWCIL